MNYRTMVKGALALSLSLIVGSSWADDVQKYGATFEQTPVGTVENDFAYTEGDGITNAKYRVTQDVDKPYGWFSGSEEDESKIIAANGGHALQLNTDASTLTNQFEAAKATELNAAIADAGAYIETDVKFVASDTDSAGIEGGQDATKFAIYAYSNEDAQRPEGVPVTTNLVVYHAYYDANGVTCYTNDVISGITIDTEKYTKLRIVMSQVDKQDYEEDPFAEPDYIKVFTVSVDGVLATSLTAYDAEGATPGSLFVTVNDTANKDVASLNFKGTGEIDNIKAGVIEEAQPLDDTWTIEGFNAGGTWPLPTASTDTALFYSNLVVNIDAADSSIGRTINAAWIGAKIIAPEAVTAETVGNWKFDLNATQTGLSFDQCKDGEYFMYLWVPVTAAKVRAAIANQSDIVYTVSVYQEGDSANAQPLTLNICPKNITITNTDEVEGEGAETIEVSDWREQGVVEPTVITVACVGGVTYTEANGVYTFTADTGYEISSIYTNGADTATASTGILDLSAAEGTINVVAAAKKIRTAIGHKWYENPGVIATTVAGKGGQAGPYRFSVGSDFAAISYGNHQAAPATGIKLFTVDSLLQGNASPIYNELVGDAQSLNIHSVRGAAISEALDVALVTAYNGTKVYSLPLSTNELELGVNAFEITNDQGITFDRAYFTSDNQYLYTSWCIEGSNDKIAKWAIADGLKGSGQKLTLVAQYTMPTRVRDFAYARINGKDLFYVLQNSKAGVCVYDVATGTSTQLTDTLVNGGNYGSIAVSMTQTSTPTLTFLPSTSDTNTDPMKVYRLAADGLSVVDTLATFTTADLVAAGITAGEYIRSAWPSEDDETLYLGYGNSNLYVLQYVEPQYTATYTGSENVIVTNTYDGASYQWDEAKGGTEIACLSGTVLSFYPTEGNVITNVTIGGVEQTGFDPACYSITVISDTNLVVLAGASAAKFKAGDTYGTVKLSAAQAEWLNGFNNYDAIDAALKTDSSNLEKRYLLNVDPLTGSGDLTITAITVGDDVKVTVELTRTGKLGAIKGTLCLYGAADLATGFGTEALGSVTFDDATFATVDTATATFTGSGAKFFKAVIE